MDKDLKLRIDAQGAARETESFSAGLSDCISLCMRLFGNVMGAFVVMKLLEHLVPVILPAVFSLYFDFFDGLLQAYVFVFLTGLYIKEAVEE